MTDATSKTLLSESKEQSTQGSQAGNLIKRDYNKKITYRQALNNSEETSLENQNTSCFLDEEDEEINRFIDSLRREIIYKCVNSDDIETIRVRERKKTGEFTVLVGLKNNKGNIKFDDSFLSVTCACQGIKVTALTIVETPSLRRLLRVSRNEDGSRFYEIITGPRSIQCNWSVDGKDYNLTVNVSDEGKVTFTNPSDELMLEDLTKNQFVTFKIGKGEKMTLHELFTKQKECKSSEIITPNPQGTTDASKNEASGITVTETKTQELAENQEGKPDVSKGEAPITTFAETKTQGVVPQVQK